MENESFEELFKIRSIDRALRIPSVSYLWDKSTKAYGKVKGANVFINWAFDTMENVVGAVIVRTLPVARLMEGPIYNLDKTLCQGLDFVEVKLPIIKEEPKEILDRTKSLVTDHLRPAVQTFMDLKEETEQRVKIIRLHTSYKVHYLRVYSWRQADKVMSTETGINILRTVDNTTVLAELMLDKYLPAAEDENYEAEEMQCCDHDNLHHTIIRLSEFGSRATRRIYFAVMDRLQHMYKIEILIVLIHVLVVIRVIKILEIPLNLILKFINDCFTAY
ncbi:lipid storage droplets surface-binding protein 2-like isoform X2 [Venturia canescens]|nr:lipid storage droplets surface-binding protein 2-like isoform X2 [Venturia canescens]